MTFLFRFPIHDKKEVLVVIAHHTGCALREFSSNSSCGSPALPAIWLTVVYEAVEGIRNAIFHGTGIGNAQAAGQDATLFGLTSPVIGSGTFTAIVIETDVLPISTTSSGKIRRVVANWAKKSDVFVALQCKGTRIVYQAFH